MEIKNNVENILFNITIEPKPNQLENIKLIETVPIDTLKLLIKSSLLKKPFIILFLLFVLLMRKNNF